MSLSSLGISDRIEEALYASTDVWKGWENGIGPIVNVIGLTVCVLVLALVRSDIYELSCKYAVSYSPRNGIFGIWILIFTWSFVSVMCQFLHAFFPIELYVAKFATNAFVCGAWIFSALWVVFFTRVSLLNPVYGVGGAAACLLLAASCGVSAELYEDGFSHNSTAAQIGIVSAPNSVFAGWLAVAASVNVGLFVNSLVQPAERLPLCQVQQRSREGSREGSRRGRRGSAAVAKQTSWIPNARSCIEASVPLLLVAFVSAFAVWRRDFVVGLPLLGALFFLKENVVRTISIVVSAVGWIVAVSLFVVQKL